MIADTHDAAGDRGRRIALAVAVAALVAHVLLVWRLDYLCDDAFIHFRYAKNLALGRGLRFNPGEQPPVEAGSMLWAALLALPESLGGSATVWSRVLSVASALLLLAWTAHIARRTFSASAAACAGVLLFLGTNPAYCVWATSGMETLPWALLVFAIYERLLGRPDEPRGLQAGGLAASALLLRPDAFVVVPLVLLVAYASLARRSPSARREVRRALLVFLAALAAVTLARWLYFHDVVPNTARAKGALNAFTLGVGFDYLVSMLLTLPGLAVVTLLGLWAFFDGQRAAGPLLVLIAVLLFAFPVLVGGDFMPMGRFLVAALPFVALALAAFLERLRARGFGPAAILGASVLVSALSVPAAFDRHLVPERLRERFVFRFENAGYETEYQAWRRDKDLARRWSREGLALARFTRPGESMVRGPIGAVGYYTDLELFDLFGLVDRDVRLRARPAFRTTPGHAMQVDLQHFYDRDPTYLGAYIARASSRIQRLLVIEPRALERGRLELVERHPLSTVAGFASDEVLVLHRFVGWSPALQPLLELLELPEGLGGLDLADARAAEALLSTRFDPNGAAAGRLRDVTRSLMEGELRLTTDAPAVAVLAGPIHHKLTLSLHAGPGTLPLQQAPAATLHLLLALEEGARVAGGAGLWVVPPTTPNAKITLEGSLAALFTFEPAPAAR